MSGSDFKVLSAAGTGAGDHGIIGTNDIEDLILKTVIKIFQNKRQYKAPRASSMVMPCQEVDEVPALALTF